MSDNDNDTTMDVRGLSAIIKALKVRRPPIARVGILGANASAPHPNPGGKYGDKTPTNAQVGAWHEFGTTKLPVRSFLRLPLNALLQKQLEQSGAFDEEALKCVMAQASLEPWVAKMAVVAEGIVIEAFHTDGFGFWVKSNMSRKKTKQTLVESGQLKNSITSEVVA